LNSSSIGRSKLAIATALSALVVGLAVGNAAPVAASTGVEVFVGYADSLRADAVNFPTPWAGSPNTIFEGCAPVASCVYDAGALRIVNNSSGPITVEAVAIHISSCTFSGWPATVVPVGASLIVTQLATATSTGCFGPAQMDTSDIGPGGENYVGNCNPDHLQPTVDLTINGQTTSYTDSGQVLNTGGFDAGNCGMNESIQWTLIGTGPCNGTHFTLAPPSQTLAIGMTATISATFTNGCGQPLSDVLVHFAASSGPNAGRTGSGVTSATGVATLSYSSALAGTDTWHATVTNLAGDINSNTVTVTWVPFAMGGGAFVIGDLENSMGANVYWWGAQWWKKDELRSSLAPASFKGFENGNLVPMCGQTWTTRPGNSSKPPKTVPAVMAVLVASHVTKKGAVISGDIVHIVLVQTNPGYSANPGHIGTGRIIGTIC
jgi:hypothetical protein